MNAVTDSRADQHGASRNAWADTRSPFRWRPVLAVSTDPVRGWTQLDLDTIYKRSGRRSKG